MARALRRSLAKIVGRERVLTDRQELELYDSDALQVHRQAPPGVVIVETVEEVQAVLRVLHEHEVPFVPRGAGTGLSGGAVSLEGAWVIDGHRLKRILEIDPEDRVAVVEPGVINRELSRHTAPLGLRFAPDPSSQSVCTIGGNLAENSGGPHCFLHGMTTRHVNRVKFLTSDAELRTVGTRTGSLDGFDYRGLVVGNEGTTGFIVETTVALIPVPPEVRTYLAAFGSLRKACACVAAMIQAGLEPAALEILDRLTIAAVEASIYRAGYPLEAAAVLLIECEGFAPVLDSNEAEVEAICRKLGALTFESASSEEARQRLWRGRKGAFGAMGRVGRDLYVLGGVVARKRLPEVIEEIQAVGERYKLKLANVFHAGDGNLHPNISFDARNSEETSRVLRASHEILEICVRAGGTLSGEHGIGIEKREAMPLVLSNEDLQTQRAVKRAFDPSDRANPGKIFPSGRHCVETGFRNREALSRIERVITSS